jgi:hypothetical protein
MSHDSLRYNEIRQKSVHNCFQRREGVYDQVVYWRVRSLEVDIHPSKPARDGLKGDWYVYHFPFLDPDTTVDKLSGFYQLCKGIQRAVPRHEVITLFVDIKHTFNKTPSAAHSAKAFDKLLLDTIGERNLFRPADLIGRTRGKAKTLQEAIALKGWPMLRQLRGKFIVVLTGPDENLASYATGKTANDRAAFIAQGLSSPDDLPGPDHAIFFNINGDKNVAAASAVQQAGLVSRAYYINSKELWQKAEAADCHHIATDKVNVRTDAWARTHSKTGFPFEVLNGPTPVATERGTVCGIWTRSDDLWGTEDDFYFHYRRCTEDDANARYDFYVCNPNSHVEDWTKGGVMARGGLGRGAPYFGIFRIGEHHALRVQYRGAPNGKTVASERVIGREGEFDADTLVFVRLRLTHKGRIAWAYGSITGTEWTPIGTAHFEEPLIYHGLGVSAFGQGRGAKYLFGVPGRRAQPGFTHRRYIGKGDPQGWADWDGDRRWRVQNFGAA